MKHREHHKDGKKHKALTVLVLVLMVALSLAVWYYFQQKINQIQALPLSMPLVKLIAAAPAGIY